MNVNIFESNIISKIDKEKNPIEKPTSKTIQRDFSKYFESKYFLSNLGELKMIINLVGLFLRKKKTKNVLVNTIE